MFRLDHLIIAVHDLEIAAANYQKLGFTVLPGGVHANGATHNALIVFADGTYLELLALTGKPPQNDAADYSFLLKMGEGFVGYALQSDNLAADVIAMQARGIKISPSQTGGRRRPDGIALEWRTAIFEDGTMSPFFIQDVTPRRLRVPDTPQAITHLNGIRGICEIIFYAVDLTKSSEYYAAITGLAPQQHSSGISFSLKDCLLTLKQMPPEAQFDDDFQAGDVPVRAVLYAAGTNLISLPQTNAAQTHGARLSIIMDEKS